MSQHESHSTDSNVKEEVHVNRASSVDTSASSTVDQAVMASPYEEEIDETFDPDNIPEAAVKKRFWSLKLITSANVAPIPTEPVRYRLLDANFLSMVTFWWINSIISTGFKRQLEVQDLWSVKDTELSVEYATEQLHENYAKRVQQYKEKHNLGPTEKVPTMVLIRALNDTFKKRFWTGGCFKICSDVGQVLSPLLVRALINFVEKRMVDKDMPIKKGVGYAVGLTFLLIFNSICMNNFFHFAMTTGSLVKSVLTNTIYKKVFILNINDRAEYNNGKITGLITNDLSRIDLSIGYFHFNWTFPISLSISIAILIVNLGVSALAGLAVVFVLLTSIVATTKTLTRQRKAANVYIDKRVQAIREIITNLKMIKLYSWEKPYNEIMAKVREYESKILLRNQLLRSAVQSTVLSIPIYSSMVAFLTLYGIGRKLKAAEVFSSLSLFNVLRQPLMLMPTAFAYANDAYIALGRINEFLQCSEEEYYLQYENSLVGEKGQELAIKIADASFHWGRASVLEVSNDKVTDATKKALETQIEKQLATGENDAGSLIEKSGENIKVQFPGLINLNLEVKRGELIVVTGLIGSGKSSLLSAIGGQMNLTEGSIQLCTPNNGELIYCQYPWIQNATIRDNILFGLKYDSHLYRKVVKSCALEADFAQFEASDHTEVGERGITLSGGQKARINLARAIYAAKVHPDSGDIILLDDVLSAVDARVGKHIMEHCINGIVSDKTRILATHQLSLIGSADRVIFMDGLGSIDMGTFNELYARNELFVNLMEYSKETEQQEEKVDSTETKEDLELKEQELQKLVTRESVVTNKSMNKKGKITISETRETGSIPLEVYLAYFKLGSGGLGLAMLPIFMLVIAISVFLQFFNSVWLTFWLDDKFDGMSEGTYIGLYVLFCFCSTIFFFLMFSLTTFVNSKSALELFKRSTSNILRAPMSFMDTTPIGRILNRFTKDIDTLDGDHPEQLRLFLISFGFIIGVFVMCIAYIPWFAIAIPPLGFIYINVVNFYSPTALDIKRMESLNRSLSYGHFNESLSGLNTIKSYNGSGRFLRKNERLLNQQDSSSFISIASQRWLSVRLDCIAASVAFIINMLCITGQFNIGPAATGLLAAYVIQLAGILSLFIRSLTQVESNMNSMERLYEYSYNLPSEAAFDIPETKPDAEWPTQGSIKFEDVSMSYRPGLPIVLKNLSVEIKPGEKVGICGRTGAGKSTIMMALFRLVELANGKISIDGVDVSKIGLHDLRSHLSIIPQDPVLFQGSIRQNLDPFDQSSDYELWDALRRSWLVAKDDKIDNIHQAGNEGNVSLHKFHLDQHVEDEGSNFSLGERQLLALARALVRNTKILILDEATSSVDYETDAKIQSTIVNEFSACTILCIAHRLKTILNYDRILVLDKGEVKEFDTPINLFKADGIFRQMCDRSDIVESDILDAK